MLSIWTSLKFCRLVELICRLQKKKCLQFGLVSNFVFVAFVQDNATMSSIWYFENHASYFVQNRRK